MFAIVEALLVAFVALFGGLYYAIEFGTRALDACAWYGKAGYWLLFAACVVAFFGGLVYMIGGR